MDIFPITLTVLRSEQFSRSIALGVLCVSRNRQHPRCDFSFSLLGEGGEDKPGSADQVLDEATTGLASRLDEEEEEDDDVVDLRAFSAIGPLMFIELLDLPPQPKVVNGWIMQQSKCQL